MTQRKKDPAAVALAKKRAASLTPERRKEIAQKASAAALVARAKKVNQAIALG